MDFDAAAKTLYRGTGSPQAVTHLSNGTQYFFRVFTRKGTTWSSGVEVTVTPVPEAASGGTLSNICTTTTTVNWNNPTPIENILVFAKAGSAITVGMPTVDISTYTSASNDWSLPGTPYENDASAFLIYNSTSGSSVSMIDLAPGTTYHFLVLNAVGTTYSTAHVFNGATLTTPPPVTGLGNTPGGNSLSVSWTNPTSCIDEVLAIARSGSAVTAVPTGDGSAYSANSVFGSGTAVSAGQFAVFKGTGNSVTISGLTNGMTYHVSVFTRSGSVWSAAVSTSGVPVDATPPAISVLSPTDAEPNFTMFGTQAVVTFNEAVQKISGAASNDNQRVRIFEDGSLVSTLDRDNAALSIAANQLTIVLPTLQANSDYEIIIGDEVIEDLGGNDFAGIASGDWEFNTSGVTITAAATLNVCAGAAGRGLGDITIQETHPADFNGAGTFTLSFNPNSGFVFQSGTGTVTAEPVAGQDVSISGVNISFTSVTFTINLDGTNDELDRIRISGLRISSDGSTPSTNIRRSGGTAVVGGNATADNFNHATINAGAAVAAPSGTSTTAFTLCQGASIAGSQATFTTNNTSLRWYSDAAATSFLIQTQNPTATQLGLSSATAGTFTVYATQTTTCESAPTAVSFVVNPRPVANGGGALPASCPGNTVTLGGSPILTTTTVGPYTFVWTGPGNPNDVANPIHTLPDPGATDQTYTYFLTVTDGNGCVSSSVSQNVLVRNLAEPVSFTSPTQFNFADTDDPVTLTGTPTGGVFSGVGVVVQGGSPATYKFSPSVATINGSPHQVTYSATLSNSCSKSVIGSFTVTSGSGVIPQLPLNGNYCGNQPDSDVLELSTTYSTILSNAGFELVRFECDAPVLVGAPPNQRFSPSAAAALISNPTFFRVFAFIRQIANPANEFRWVSYQVRVNPVPNVFITGLTSGVAANPRDFCNASQQIEISGNFEGGTFDLASDAGFTQLIAGLSDLVPTAVPGKKNFNPAIAYADAAGTGIKTMYVRYSFNPGTIGSTNQPCTGVIDPGIQIRVNPLPAITYSSAPPNGSVFCNNDSPVSLQTSVTTNVVYSGQGVSDQGGGVGIFTPLAAFTLREQELNTIPLTTPQSFSVSATVTNNLGCRQTATRTVEVRPIPPATFSFGGVSNFCYQDGGVKPTFTGGQANGRYLLTFQGLPLSANIAVPSPNYLFDYDQLFDHAVNNGANPLSTISISVIYTANDPVRISCLNTQTQLFRISPNLPVTIAGIEDQSDKLYCSNEGPFLLTLSPPLGSLSIDSGPSETLSNNGRNFQFDRPDGGTFILTYSVVTGVGCNNSQTKTVRLLPSPTAQFTIPPKCDGDLINFNSQNNTNGVVFQWDFGDNTPFASTPSTTHQYASPGNYFVRLRIDASEVSGITCTDSTSQYLTVGLLPQGNFRVLDVCEGNSTRFQSQSPNIALATLGWDFGDGDILPLLPTSSAAASIPAGTHGGRTTGTYGNPIHVYANSGTYNVIMDGKTAPVQGECQTNVPRAIDILQVVNPSPSNPYFMAEIDGGRGFWRAEDEAGNATWEFGIPDKSTIRPDPITESSWTTNITGSYLANDVSYVNSPCFTLSAFTKPTFSLKYWVNTERKDGAVLQYSINGGGSWARLGTLVSGKEWYNAQSIAASPGGQSLFGWAGSEQDQWKEGKHSLNGIPSILSPTTTVRFRLAFASEGSEELDGFAFTNVRIEERNRISLVENFTNTTSPNYGPNNTGFLELSSSEAIRIQYHAAFPGLDAFNALNPMDNNARSAFYGITSALQNQSLIPRGYIDGFSQGNFSANWDNEYLELQSLVSSPVTITLTDNTTNENALGGQVKVSAKVRALESISATPLRSYRLFIVVVEKQVGSNGFVMRKMLPNAAGVPIPNKSAAFVLDENDEFEFVTDLTSISGFVDASQLAFVAFVQDINSKDVLQSAALDFAQTLVSVTGREEIGPSISLYPNPADRELTIELPSAVSKTTGVQLVDQLGRVAFSGSFAPGEGKKTIDTSPAAGGLYFVQIGSGKEAVRKKVLVVHSE
ncbi:MAG: PKD domain-containing protein [Cyclobacteriaceae bacterium]|nr:PKD domain-containing protein [Cyclobacteriaceae bacterium]